MNKILLALDNVDNMNETDHSKLLQFIKEIASPSLK